MLLIDAGGLPPEPQGPHREPWIVTFVLDHLLKWPVLIVWLLAGALLTDGWAAVAFAWSAVFVAAWRGSRAFEGVGTMRDHIQ
jgi:hypothetical protein